MADHVRNQIRDALVTALTGLPTTGAHVFANRISPIQPNQLPALLIETNGERIKPASVMDEYTLDRTLLANIRIVTKANTNLDDVLDEAMKEVEGALYESFTANSLNGLVKSMSLESIDVGLVGEQEKHIGQATMVWAVNYFTRGNAPDVSI